MDVWQAQHDFWNSFGVPAYEEHNVPEKDKNVFPRITYESATSVFGSLVSITASIWTRSTSWATADELANYIQSYILNQGRTIQNPYNHEYIAIPVCKRLDDGYMRIYIGDTTFAQKMDDPEDDQIKRIILNVTFEFMTK